MNNAALRKSVLVVDDEPQVLRAIEDTLEDQFEVFAETSPEVATRLLKELPDLSVILSDQRMPGMSGDQFLAKAQEMSQATRLLITGYADLEAVIRAVNLGHIFGYVSKPWSPDHLKLVVLKAAEHYQLLRELQSERDLLHNLMDNIPDAIFFKDLKHRFVRLNHAHAARLGIARPEDAVGRVARDFVPLDVAIEREEEDRQIFRSGVPLTDRVRHIAAPPDKVRWYSTTKAPIKDNKGQVTGLVGITRDITERQQADEKIRRLNRVYAVLSGINSLIVRVHDREELFRESCRIAVNAGEFPIAWAGLVDREAMQVKPVAWEGVDEAFLGEIRMTVSADASDGIGIVGAAVRNRAPVIVNDIEHDPRVLVKAPPNRGSRSLVVLPLVVDGEAIGVVVLHAAVVDFFDDEEMKLLLELAGDISFALDHLEKEATLDYLAYYDSLTGLANRTLFHERIGQLIDAAGRQQSKLAVVLLDIERFKVINDTLGRTAGDELLKQIVERLVRYFGGPDRLARISGDRFAAVIPGVSVEDEVARRIEKARAECFGPPFHVADTELRVAARIGIAIFPSDGADADALFRNAEAALKKAKETNERLLFYTQEMTERVAEKLALENKLRQALENDEFVLEYQPKRDLESTRIAGLEGLIRWRSPDLGLVPPAKFIPLLEETGLIIEVGAWVLRRAVLDHHRWLAQGLAPPRVAVNVSAIQLRQRDFVNVVRSAIEQGASPPGIDLEITESLLMEDIESNIRKLKEIRDLGVCIAIDDFGTGYSSLGYLARLPVQSLKIDRSFIITMLNDPDAMTLVQTIISLAQSLRLKVVAEGVDSEEQAKFLRLLRCDEMQGYLFSKPLPLDDITALLKQGAAG